MTPFLVPAWLVWTAIAAGLIAADLALAGAQLILLGSALGALAGATAAGLGFGLEAQVWVFLAGVILATPLILALRPRERRGVRDRDAGWADGMAATTLDWSGRIGVKLRGDFYPARLATGQPPEAGMPVIVSRLEGITAIVEPVPGTSATDVRNKPPQPATNPDISAGSTGGGAGAASASAGGANPQERTDL